MHTKRGTCNKNLQLESNVNCLYCRLELAVDHLIVHIIRGNNCGLLLLQARRLEEQ